ncbi:unnamed protein product [Ectocarpus sp. CCAP 1310/34]|nr:unnamed protein product [Ectocarpus sp. CCAP 1310/34]
MRPHIARHILERVNTRRVGKAAPRVYSRWPLAPRSAKDEGSFVSITLSSAKKSTKNMPCTNVPMECIFCNQWEWKYSVSRNVDELHAADAKLRKTDSIGRQFLEDIFVSEDAKKAVGVMLEKGIKRMGGTLGTHKTKVELRGNTTGRTGAKPKGGKGKGRRDTRSESSDSSSESSDEQEEEEEDWERRMRKKTKKKKKKNDHEEEEEGYMKTMRTRERSRG